MIFGEINISIIGYMYDSFSKQNLNICNPFPFIPCPSKIHQLQLFSGSVFHFIVVLTTTSLKETQFKFLFSITLKAIL